MSDPINTAEQSVLINSVWMNLFERLLFPVTLFIGVGLMFYLLSIQQYVEVTYFAIPILVMVMVLILERKHPLDKSWNKNIGDRNTDLGSLGIVAFIMDPLMTALGPAIAVSILMLLDLPQTFSVFKSLPLWAEVLIVIVMIDFNKYWFHRWSHHNLFLWRFHSSHHAVKRMYLLNGFRLHPIYHAATYILAILPPLVLGASLEALIMHSVVLGIAGSFQHANIKLQHGPLNYLFSTNELHRWHHSHKFEEGSKNCGAIFIVFDIMFGSYLKNLTDSPEKLGIKGEEHYPMNNYWKQLLVPFMWDSWMNKPMKKNKVEAHSHTDNKVEIDSSESVV
jgi:sterol desaturase/sphingolipid hydroxylase (fatty acid hydroxylase superfamily)